MLAAQEREAKEREDRDRRERKHRQDKVATGLKASQVRAQMLHLVVQLFHRGTGQAIEAENLRVSSLCKKRSARKKMHERKEKEKQGEGRMTRERKMPGKEKKTVEHLKRRKKYL